MRRAVSILAAGVLLVGTPTAYASPDPELKLTTVTLGQASVAPAGLKTEPVTITVTGSYKPDPDGVLTAVLKPQSGGNGNLFSDELRWVSGTDEHSTWRGVVNVPAIATGTYKVIGVVPASYESWIAGMGLDETPYDGPTLTIKGTHIPKVTATQIPAVVPYQGGFKVKWTVLDSATGKPYGTKIPVAAGTAGDVLCYGDAVTDVNGVVTRGGGENACLAFPGVPAQYWGATVLPKWIRSVSAKPAKTSAKVGTLVPVSGSQPQSWHCQVQLQRLYGASQWRTVATTMVRESGRFTVNAQPAYKGKISYRVLMPACGNFVAGSTKPFSITGT
ncbi:hypothetical protein ACFVWG_16940 [Kribbella sp. NPDC058245]|uniref:hypothetical protein n=1 Tax=Kribbella sp. NPDC058245 TaxID=3346399 RepID=UPI0036EE9583